MQEYKRLYEKYYDSELYIIGALDCFGVPHTPDNINLKSYIDMVADDLSARGINVNYVNLHSIGCNKTWALRNIIDADYTKKDYYDLNLIQSKKAIATKNIFPFPLNPNFLKTYYSNPSNPGLKITSHYVDAKNPIFFYSCGQMNLHHYLKIRSEDIKQIAPEIIFHLNKNLDKTINDVKDMIDYLIYLNPSVEIYMFGVYPMFEQSIVRKVLAPFYASVNKKVKNFFEKYDNVHFVDVLDNINYVAPSDCHPNYDGQVNMKNKVLDLIK